MLSTPLILLSMVHLFLILCLFEYAHVTCARVLVPTASDLSRCNQTWTSARSNTRCLEDGDVVNSDERGLQVPHFFQGSATEAFAQLKEIQARSDNPLHHPQFVQWFKYVNDPRKAIEVLDGHVNDDALLFKLLTKAQNKRKLKGVATTLKTALLNHWVQLEKNPRDIFSTLELDQIGEWEDLLKSPNFREWMNYVDKFNARETTKKLRIDATVEAIKPLTDRFFSTDDQELVTLIEQASRLRGHEDVVKKLRAYLLDYWVTKDKKPEQVFRLFHLNEITDSETLPQNPKVFEWITFVNKLDAYEARYASDTIGAAIKTLTDQFGVTLPVYEILHKTMSGKYELRQFWINPLLYYWAKKDKPPEEVFRWFKLDKQVDWKVLVKNQKFLDWRSYVEYFNSVSSVPGRAREPALLILTTQFGNENAFNIVLEAEWIELLDELLERWAKNNEKSPTKIFRLLGLHKVKESQDFSLGTKYFYLSWVKYVLKLNAHQLEAGKPEVMTSAFSVLSKQFKDDKLLFKSIISFPSLEGYEGYISAMHAELRKRWLAKGKDPEEVFSLYQSHVIDDLKTGNIENVLFKEWVKYVDEYDAKHAGYRVLAIKTLTKYLEEPEMIRLVDHLALNGEESSSGIIFKKALYAYLLERFEMDENRVLQMIGLDGSNPFIDQAYPSSRLEWLIDAAERTNPTTTKKLYQALVSMYNTAEITTYISVLESEGNPKLHSIAKTLASVQREVWLEKEYSIADVYGLLEVVPEAHQNIIAWLLYCNLLFEKAPHESNAFIPFIRQVSNKRFRFKLLGAARDFSHLKDKATQMQMEEAERVFEEKIQSPSWVFGFIGLAEDKNVLRNPVFSKWLEYLEHYNRENPKHQQYLYTPLLANFGLDGVEKMIEEAKQSPGSFEIAKELENQLQELLNSSRTELYKDFLELPRPAKTEQTLTNVYAEAWVHKLDAFNKEHSAEQITLIDVLVKFNDQDEIISMIDYMIEHDRWKALAKRLQKELNDKWQLAAGS
ncbi:hypothetical protein PsorP6_017366 [Peronosclerospora sorghi]|uniref:Uncharacterized protein n=1 Tax=Peronosclerospora sorghi TaxID=230839 RepID=A0ACC0WL91_9STRA|nr:hypothetical protein PsorP6_017366 [Peronosclerospora sorghi]